MSGDESNDAAVPRGTENNTSGVVSRGENTNLRGTDLKTQSRRDLSASILRQFFCGLWDLGPSKGQYTRKRSRDSSILLPLFPLFLVSIKKDSSSVPGFYSPFLEPLMARATLSEIVFVHLVHTR